MLLNKYNIEGDIDFYSELSKDLDEDEEGGDNCCLITNKALTDNYVVMECGHKFNYEPLYNDILNHKKKFNSMERKYLKAMEIRCPYCRNVQKQLLPYYENLGFAKVHGVNYLEIGPSSWMSSSWVEGECTTPDCTNKFVTLVPSLDKCYCMYHKYGAIHQFMKEKKAQAKAQAKAEKEAAKEAAAKAAKEAKAEAKAQIVICSQILKTGKNKGQSCCNKASPGSLLCKRHTIIS
jgi:hypothetical protein